MKKLLFLKNRMGSTVDDRQSVYVTTGNFTVPAGSCILIVQGASNVDITLPSLVGMYDGMRWEVLHEGTGTISFPGHGITMSGGEKSMVLFTYNETIKVLSRENKSLVKTISVAVSTSPSQNIDISSLGFTTVYSVFAQARNDTANVKLSTLCSVRSFTNTTVVINTMTSKNTRVSFGGNIEGL